jgi:hypothetical protein
MDGNAVIYEGSECGSERKQDSLMFSKASLNFALFKFGPQLI